MARADAYTKRQIQFIRTRYSKMSVQELAAAFNEKYGTDKTASAIKTACTNRGYKSGRPKGNPKGSLRIFTKEQARYIEEKYKEMTEAEVTASLNKEFGTGYRQSQIAAFINNHKILSGRTGFFEKGHQPFNKGTKGFMKSNSGTFVKGHIPGNQKPLWSERIDSKDGFIQIKVPERDPHTGFPTRYKHKHVWIWEQANGLIPENHVVAFKDGNKLNCSLDNLMLITRAELLYLNQYNYHDIPAELRDSFLVMAKLECKTFKLIRKMQAET
ncbi:MAG TPA: HNH endonuclease signature motif containing protein [Nitrospirota bacterium]|jgi:hypothetical protein